MGDDVSRESKWIRNAIMVSRAIVTMWWNATDRRTWTGPYSLALKSKEHLITEVRNLCWVSQLIWELAQNGTDGFNIPTSRAYYVSCRIVSSSVQCLAWIPRDPLPSISYRTDFGLTSLIRLQIEESHKQAREQSCEGLPPLSRLFNSCKMSRVLPVQPRALVKVLSRLDFGVSSYRCVFISHHAAAPYVLYRNRFRCIS
jgi:hypothetical protein